MSDIVEIDRDGAVAIIWMNRPQVLNAINGEMMEGISAALDLARADESVRVVVLAGRGRAFSAGYDIGAVTEGDLPSVAEARAYYRGTWDFAQRLWEYPKPLIAAVHGHCLGGACEVAMLCDLTFAGEGATFGEPEIRFSAAPPTLIMPWLIPMKVAKELLLSGATISAARAAEIGLINHVVADDAVMASALRAARVLSAVSPLAVTLTKESLRRTYDTMGLACALEYHNNMVAILDGTVTPEYQAFAEVATKDGVRAALKWRDAQFENIGE